MALTEDPKGALQMPENFDSARLKFQYSIRTLLLVTAFVAILFSSYRIGSTGVFLATVIFGGLVGTIFVILTRRNLGRYSLFVFAAVMIGATIAVERAARGGQGSWLCAREKRDNSMPVDGFAYFGWAAIGGGVLGGGAGVFMASIAANRQRSRNHRKPGSDDQSPDDEDTGS